MPAPLDPAGIFSTLDQHNVAYVLIGGLAAVIRGSTAMTNDADIVPASDSPNLSRLSDALQEELADGTRDAGRGRSAGE